MVMYSTLWMFLGSGQPCCVARTEAQILILGPFPFWNQGMRIEAGLGACAAEEKESCMP